jgi:hypothetical protein
MEEREQEHVSMDEVEEESAVALPDKEVLSLLDVNANVDLGLDLAAPVDLAAAANLNVAAPIEAAASANVLSPDAEAVSLAHQQGTISQTDSGTADAIANQHAAVDQNSSPDAGGATGGAVDTGGVGDAVGGATSGVGDAVGGAGDAVGGATGGVDSLLSGGNLLDANVNIDANANLTAPIDGAVAANANVAAPIDAAVAANVGSDHGVAEALAPQEVDIQQNLDHVTSDAEANQDASVDQQ